MGLAVGRRATLIHIVGEGDTALSVGSGDVPVLATPRLLALFEAACLAALDDAGLDADQTTVGTRLTLEHLLATPVGEAVTVDAQLTLVDGRLLRLECTARDDADRLLGRAEITRVVVDRERFLERAQRIS